MEPDGLITALFRAVYRYRKARVPGDERPRLCWLPKYTVPVELPASVFTSSAPDDELEKQLSSLGFQLEYWTRETVCFVRGKKVGDFSIKYLRIRLSFPRPLAKQTEVLLEAADMCLFDTGDFWELAQQIQQVLNGSVNSLEKVC